jgi:hypothetical protein
MDINITVQLRNDKPMFCIETDEKNLVFAEELDVFDSFIGGSLKIYRDSKLFCETTFIKYHGTHAARASLYGLEKVFSESVRHDPPPSLSADQFQIGDKLVFSTPKDLVDIAYCNEGQTGWARFSAVPVEWRVPYVRGLECHK